MLTANPGKVKLLGQLALMKKAYPNGLIYFYRGCWADRERRTGVTRNTFNTIISRLIENGWATRAGKTVRLIGKNALAAQYATSQTKFIQLDTRQNLSDQLRLKLFESKHRQVNYARFGESAQDKGTSYYPKTFLREAYSAIPTSSLCRTFGVKRTMANAIMKKLESHGAVSIRRNPARFVAFSTYMDWQNRYLKWDHKYGNVHLCFYHRGVIFEKRPNEYKMGSGEILGTDTCISGEDFNSISNILKRNPHIEYGKMALGVLKSYRKFRALKQMKQENQQ